MLFKDITCCSKLMYRKKIVYQKKNCKIFAKMLIKIVKMCKFDQFLEKTKRKLQSHVQKIVK